MTRVVGRVNGLAPLRKGLLLCALVLAALAQGSVAVSAVGRAKEDRIAAYERTVEDIGRTIDSAEASMIYRDEARANELLAEAIAAIGLLPLETEEQMADKQALEEKIEKSRATMRREVALDDPRTLATLPAEAGNVAALASDGASFWSIAADGSVHRIAQDGAMTAAGKATPSSLLVGLSSGGALAVSKDGTATQFAKSSSSLKIDLGDEIPTEAAVYASRLYVLDAGHNRIMRHVAASGGYGAGQHYLKDGTDLTGAVSMAIDNAVWALKANGGIIRIMQGKQEPFTASPADPAVTAAAKLRTPSETDDLFVLDASPSRILRFDKKTGAFVAQYVSPRLAGATDLAIEKGGKSALVSIGSTVLKFELPTGR